MLSRFFHCYYHQNSLHFPTSHCFTTKPAPYAEHTSHLFMHDTTATAIHLKPSWTTGWTAPGVCSWESLPSLAVSRPLAVVQSECHSCWTSAALPFEKWRPANSQSRLNTSTHQHEEYTNLQKRCTQKRCWVGGRGEGGGKSSKPATSMPPHCYHGVVKNKSHPYLWLIYWIYDKLY